MYPMWLKILVIRILHILHVSWILKDFSMSRYFSHNLSSTLGA
jgi:uncharacterized membrane protein YdbT with pleckstrin-like domain